MDTTEVPSRDTPAFTGFSVLFVLFVAVDVIRGGCGPPVDSMGTDSGGVSGRVDVSFIVTHGACRWATASAIHTRASNIGVDKCIIVSETEKAAMVIQNQSGSGRNRSE